VLRASLYPVKTSPSRARRFLLSSLVALYGVETGLVLEKLTPLSLPFGVQARSAKALGTKGMAGVLAASSMRGLRQAVEGQVAAFQGVLAPIINEDARTTNVRREPDRKSSTPRPRARGRASNAAL
jgi:hypothetical protein